MNFILKYYFYPFFLEFNDEYRLFIDLHIRAIFHLIFLQLLVHNSINVD